MTAPVAWLDYRVRWRTGESRPGRHPARQSGAGGALRGYRPFWQVPDTRRIDIRRSVMDPAGGLVVRQMENRGSITVFVAADLSRSMQAYPHAAKMGCVVDLVQAVSRTAHRAGDAFGFIGFDEAVRATPHARASRARGPVQDVLTRLRHFVPEGRSATGLADLSGQLPMRRSLVLLISDFLLPMTLLRAALGSLAHHDVAPIVLHDPQDFALPSSGLLRVRDAETGGTRLLFMSQRLQAQRLAAQRAWRDELDSVFLRFCRPAFHNRGVLDVVALGQHLSAA